MSDEPQKPAPAESLAPLEAFFKGNRTLAAAALFLIGESYPLLALVLSLRDGAYPWAAVAVVFLVAGAIPPVGVAMGRRWGYRFGQYLCWGNLVFLLLRVMQQGFSPLQLLPAGLLGALLVSLQPSPRRTETRRLEKKADSPSLWLKENVEAIVVAFIMALVIRCFCIEVFKIPSSSMEPTLLGDVSPQKHSREGCPFRDYHVPLGPETASGDRIMVTKYYFSFSPVERFDVVVFKFPLNQAKNFIKRVVGLPDEELKVWHGNIYTRKPGEEKFRIARRSLRTQDSIWIDPARELPGFLSRMEDFQKFWEAPFLAEKAGHAEFRVRDGELATTEAAGQRSSVFRYSREISDGQGSPVGDLHLAFDVELTSPRGQVFAEIVNEHGRFEARLDTEGGSQLRYHAPGNEGGNPTGTLPIADFHFAADRKYRLDLAVFDGMAYVRVNGMLRAKLPFIDFREDLKETERPVRRLAFGARDATFKVSNLSVGRDIYYRGRERELGLREDEIVKIPPHSYMMMGDNVANSHDSRAWVRRTFTLKNGKTIVCEAQQIVEGYSDYLTQLQQKYDLPQKPDIGIDGDEHGNEVPIFLDELASRGEPEPYRFVDEKFLVGKALWIWWPQGRWFHLIR